MVTAYTVPLHPEVENRLHRSLGAFQASMGKMEGLIAPFLPLPSFPETLDSRLLRMLGNELKAELFFIQALTYRPCLQMVMNRRIPIEHIPTGIIQLAKCCIVAMQHGMSIFATQYAGQPIITNIWDTAHR